MLLIDNHVIRGVTNVSLSRDVHVADPDELAAESWQLEVLGELRDIDGLLPQICWYCDTSPAPFTHIFRDSTMVPLCSGCYTTVMQSEFDDRLAQEQARPVSDRPPKPPPPPKDREVG